VRIAQIAPLYEAVPPPAYGGTERVIAALCDGLVDAGHDVVLFAAGTSSTRAELRPMTPAPLRTRMGRQELIEVSPHLHLKMLAEVYRSDDFDVIHAHTDVWTMPFANVAEGPTVVTLHGRLDLPLVSAVLSQYPDVPLVAISDSQRSALDGVALNWAGTVHHGLDLSRYLNAPRTAGDHLAFVGRASIEKRLDIAIALARQAGRELHIAAKVDPLDVAYFETHVEPLLGNDTRFIGEITEQDKPAFFAGARATLFPADWPEPFGLVMIESLAAGTPVIALRRGSVPEILVDGVTGFVCDDVADMAAAIERVDEIDAADCRRRALEFSREAMCERYLGIYRQLAGHRGRRFAGVTEGVPVPHNARSHT
jgi:glycosyltransferase involved in cell wall biosynthesis